jgi:hypothetical protein
VFRFVVAFLLTVGINENREILPIPAGQKTGDGQGNETPSRPPVFQNKKPKIPLAAQWDLKVLEEKHRILNKVYNPEKNQIIWNLQTKEKTPLLFYHVGFLDGDLLELTKVELSISPRQPEYETGSRIQASFSLPEKEICQETAKVVIQKSKKEPSKK